MRPAALGQMRDLFVSHITPRARSAAPATPARAQSAPPRTTPHRGRSRSVGPSRERERSRPPPANVAPRPPPAHSRQNNRSGSRVRSSRPPVSSTTSRRGSQSRSRSASAAPSAVSESDYHAADETGPNRYTPRRSAPLPSSANIPVSLSDSDSPAESRPRKRKLRQGTQQASARPAPAASRRRAATSSDAAARSRPTRKAPAPTASRARPRRAATAPVASARSRPQTSHPREHVYFLTPPATLIADNSCPGGRDCPDDCSWHPLTPREWGRSTSTTDTTWDGWSRDAIRWYLPDAVLAVSVEEWEAMSPFARKFYTMGEDLVGGRGWIYFLDAGKYNRLERGGFEARFDKYREYDGGCLVLASLQYEWKSQR